MKSDNRGFSYVELILVLAIMAIMTAMITISMGLVTRADVNRGAEKVESLLGQARTNSMARGTERGMLCIWYEGSNYYYYIGSPASYTDADRVEFMSSSVALAYTTIDAPDTVVSLAEGQKLYILYNQATGAFRESTAPVNAYISSLVLSKGDNVATIRLYPETGKCEIE